MAWLTQLFTKNPELAVYLALGIGYGVGSLRFRGALFGVQTFTPGLAAVQEKSGSPIAVLGYTGAVPVGHVLLTTWGSVIVLLMSR